ncbi:MAG: beta-ketoacyl synthase chain length factor, partial [Gammaproteobacteria bacterium]|nr:beta-ketoacyl synthase chain length factor [Gammaproteobacteria bacterium]
GNDAINAASIPSMMRRRCSQLNKMVIETAIQALESKTPDYTVFGTQHGDSAAFGKLLQDINAAEILSPATFTQSVQNASVGMFSILQQIRQNMTCVTAREDTFCMAMLEALSWLQLHPTHTVLLLMSDVYVPEFYSSLHIRSDHEYALALLLTSKSEDQGAITAELSEKKAVDREYMPAALDFLAWLLAANKEPLVQQTSSQTITWVQAAT